MYNTQNHTASADNNGMHAANTLDEQLIDDEDGPVKDKVPATIAASKKNDADVIGNAAHPDMQVMLAQNVKYMTGDLYDQGDRRNTQAGKWKLNKNNWLTLLGSDWSPFTVHKVSKSKQGKSIVVGETIEGNRNAEAVKSIGAVVIDIDSGPTYESVRYRLVELDQFAIMYTSFNNKKTEIVLKHDDVVRKLKLDDTPNRMQILEYLKMHHKDRYDDDFLHEITVKDARHHGPKGLQIILKTPPLHKFRVVLPLWEPVELSSLGTTASQWKDAWADIVTGYCVNTLGISFDSTSCDVNRLFYTARHPEGGEWETTIIQGAALRVEEIETYSKNAYLKNREPFDPFMVAGGVDDDRPPQCLAPSGMVLNALNVKIKDRFLLDEVILTESADKIVRVVSDGKLEIECPFSHEHSSAGGSGTIAMSPHVNEYGFWSVSCHHDACQGRHKLEFLEEMLKENWFPEECLTDSTYLIPGNGEDEDLPQNAFKMGKPTGALPTTNPLSLSEPLWDEKYVDGGFCKRKNAEIVKNQIANNLRERASLVVTEGGKARVFLHPLKGQLPKIWEIAGLKNYYLNNKVLYKEKGDDKYTKICPAHIFLTDSARITYEGTQFEPDLKKADSTKFNTFNGFPITPVEGNWDLLQKHIRDNLICGNESDDHSVDELFNWFMTWLADLFQNPGRKMGSSLAICGEQGTGKSKVFDWLREGIGGYAIKVSSKKHLVGNFNEHLDSKILVVAEEAFWSGDKEAAGILKDLITGQTYMVERKGFDAVQRPNYIRPVFVTNERWAIPTDDNSDARRFFVLMVSIAQKQNASYFAAIDRQMKNGGLEAMVYDLVHWNPEEHGLTWDSLRAAPWTPARAQQASYSASPAMASLLQIIEDGYFTDSDYTQIVLSETEITRVERSTLAEYLRGKVMHGGTRMAPKDAITTLLGDDAWHELKHDFAGGRLRYVEFPPLNDLRETVAKKFR